MGKVLDNLDFTIQGTEAFMAHTVSNKIQLSDSKHTLLNVGEEAVVIKALKHKPEVVQVLFRSCAGDQEVVDILFKAELQTTQHIIYKSLEGLCSIA